nr:hypothetical protein [Tanacetum cinerariifolium]
MNKVTDIPDSFLISFYISRFKLNLQHKLLVLIPTTLGNAFFLARIIEARFEAIAKKEKKHIVKKKTDVILPLQSELGSPKTKGSLNTDEDIDDDESSSAVDGVFDMGGGEALGVGEDNNSGNADTDGGNDVVESGGISILNSLNGHGSPRSSQLCGTICTTDVQVLIDERVDKDECLHVYLGKSIKSDFQDNTLRPSVYGTVVDVFIPLKKSKVRYERPQKNHSNPSVIRKDP